MRFHLGVFAALCITGATYAHPEDPVRLRLDYSISYDSNYFRVANDAQALALLGSTDTSVTTYRTGVGIDADLRFARQLVVLKGDFARVDFDRVFLKPTTELNALADWKWVLGNRLSGGLNYRISESLQSQADVSSTEQSKLAQTIVGFSASYQVNTSFYLDYGLNESTYKYAPVARKVLDHNERSQSLGWRLPTRAGNFLGMQYRTTEGDYPQQVPARTFEQTELNFNGSWAPSGMSRIAWAFGQTRRIDGATTTRQPTWSLNGNWTPTGKTNFTASWGRTVGSSENANISTTTVTENAALGATWNATGKLSLSGTLRGQNVQYDTTGRTDQIQGGGLTLGYQALRSVQATVGYDTERRNSSLDSVEYRAEKWSAGLRVAF